MTDQPAEKNGGVMDKQSALSLMIKSKGQPGGQELQELGTKIGKLYTDRGFPVDMALTRLEGYTSEQMFAIIDGVCQWLIEHKRNSGATEAAIERQRHQNLEMLERYIDSGEMGAY